MKQEREPAAIRELHRIRQEMIAEEKRVGSDKYWAEANRQGREFARRHGLKYVESPSSAYVLHDKPTKHKVH
jgi:threonyl-tRNA synthetase